jgi:hypothetical protein
MQEAEAGVRKILESLQSLKEGDLKGLVTNAGDSKVGERAQAGSPR